MDLVGPRRPSGSACPSGTCTALSTGATCPPIQSPARSAYSATRWRTSTRSSPIPAAAPRRPPIGGAGPCTLREMLGGAVKRMGIAALAGVVVLAAGSCGGDGGNEDATNPTAPSTTSAPTTTLDEETQKEEEASEALPRLLGGLRGSHGGACFIPSSPGCKPLMTGDHQRRRDSAEPRRNARRKGRSGTAARSHEEQP